MAKILVVADREADDDTAIRRAARLAEKLGDSLHVASFGYELLSDMEDLVSASVAKKIRKTVLDERKEAAQAHLSKYEVKARVTAVWEQDVAGWVTAHTRDNDYRFVIKTSAHTSTLFYTASERRLMRECPVPVMILARKKWKKRNRILATVDLASKSKVQQALNEEVINVSLALAETMGGSVHVCNVVPFSKVLMDLDVIDSRNLQKKARDKARRAMEKLLAGRIDGKHSHLAVGEPHRKIPSLANKLKADMVVMGSRGRKGAKGRLLGNTAEKTLDKLYTDILTLRAS